jgi:hypothetical protein
MKLYDLFEGDNMRSNEFITEKWSQKYKSSINCSHPKGFSQRAHCAGKKKHNESVEMEMVCEDCGMCETHGNPMMEIKQRLDAKCGKGKHKEGTKIKGGIRVNNCVPNESVAEGEVVSMKDDPSTIKRLARQWWTGNPQEYAHAQQMLNRMGWDIYEDEDDIIVEKDGQEYALSMDELEAITESRGGNYEQMGYRKSNKDKFALLDRTLDAVILTTNNFAEAKQEAIEWAEYDDIRTEVIQQDIGKRVFTVDGYAGAEKYLDESEAWQKANKRDKTDCMSRKAVKTYRREHPGSKLQTAVTTKPGKLKKGSKASKRRKSYCSRSRGQMKMHNISCAKTPDKAICKARRRWNC